MAPSTPNLAQDLVRIHKIITRAINVGLTKGTEYLQTGFPPSQVILGYSRYTACLVSVLGSHHQVEDQILFPAFRKVIPSAPYGQLASDHNKIEMLLALFPNEITSLSGDVLLHEISVITDSLHKILGIWASHYQLEEQYFSTHALNAVLDLDGQRLIGDAVGKFIQERPGPVNLLIPFNLYNLEPTDRAAMAANFPTNVIDELVPKVWIDQWTPMKPFLLN